jgi:hypothetical protein
MNEVLSPFLQPILVFVLPALAIAITAWIVVQIQAVRAQVGERNFALLRQFALDAVWAAEQAWQSDKIKKEQRLEYAEQYIQNQADKYHIPVHVHELVVLVTASVAQELNKDRIVIPGNANQST